jgi:hypothetical protein
MGTTTKEMSTFVLTEDSQYSAQEAFEEAVRMIEVASDYTVDTSNPQMLSQLFREFLHWLYASPGTHETPSKMLKEALEEEFYDELASTDATPEGGVKTND